MGFAAISLIDDDLLHETQLSGRGGGPTSNGPGMTWEMQSDAAKCHKETIRPCCY